MGGGGGHRKCDIFVQDVHLKPLKSYGKRQRLEICPQTMPQKDPVKIWNWNFGTKVMQKTNAQTEDVAVLLCWTNSNDHSNTR